MIHLMPCRNPCRLYIHLAFTYSVGPPSVVWSELGYLVSPTLNVNPALCVIPCKFFGRFIDLQCCDYRHLPSDFPSKIQSSMTILGFGQWMNSSIILDSICSLIHKKCHPKCYPRHIKYHMTLNIMFSVVVGSSCSLVVNMLEPWSEMTVNY